MKKYVKIIVLFIIAILLCYYNNVSAETTSEIQSKANQNLTIKTEYVYDVKTNTVIGKMISNNPLKPTKISWTLSQDALTYTTILKYNGSYMTTVEDIYGNIANVLIEVTRN